VASADDLQSYRKSRAKQGQTKFSEQAGKSHASYQQQNKIDLTFNHRYWFNYVGRFHKF